MINRENYLLVKRYLAELAEEGKNPKSLERYRFSLRHLLIWADETHLSKANTIRPGLILYVANLRGRRGEEHLAPESKKKIIENAVRFFRWAKEDEKTCRVFNSLPGSWLRKLKAPRMEDTTEEKVFVALDEAITLATYPIDKSNLTLWRMQASIAFLFLSGMRIKAFTTLPIKAVDLTNNEIRQWPALGVKTKNGKRATTHLLPIPELLNVVKEWDAYVREHYPDNFPWFTPLKADWGKHQINLQQDDAGNPALGENRPTNFNKRMKALYDLVGLLFKSAHKYRNGHAVWGLMHSRDMADYKALSVNLMHDDIETTDGIYVEMVSSERKSRIERLGTQPTLQPTTELLAHIERLSKTELRQAHKDLMAALSRVADKLADQ